MDSHTHTHTLSLSLIKIPLKLSEILTSNRMISKWVKVESRGDQPRQLTSYSERHPTQRELQGTARCGPEELKGPSSVLLFIGSQDD